MNRFIEITKDNEIKVRECSGLIIEPIEEEIRKNPMGLLNECSFFDNYVVLYDDGDTSEYDSSSFIVKVPNSRWMYEDIESLTDADIEKIEDFYVKNKQH